MDQAIRNLLQGATQNARTLLEREVFAQLESIYDVLPSGVIAKKPGPHLDATGRLVRMKVVEAIQHRIAGGKEPAEAVDDYAREAAFTCLNRFVALKMLEARELVQVCVSKGDQSGGFREFCGLATGLSELPDGGYQLYLECLFDELSTEVKVLFDRRDPASLIWPRRPALLGLLEILNQPELAGVWKEDETIGWVYQYFNSQEERRKMRDESRSPRNSRELAVRNQFFTPRYVVEYLTDNTLGRIWYEMRKGITRLVKDCRYLVRRPNELFLGPGQELPNDIDENYPRPNLSQEELWKLPVYVLHRPKKDPRDLKLLDPACGSGHFLLYAFDLLITIYEEAWHDDYEINSETTGNSLRAAYPTLDLLRSALPSLILSHNLHGIDIDHRAAQIAVLALWMRGQRAYRDAGIPREKRPQISKANIVCAEPMPGEHSFLREFIELYLSSNSEDKLLAQLLCSVFDSMKLAGEVGSLLKIEEVITAAVEEAKKQWFIAPKYAQRSFFSSPVNPASQPESGIDVKGITDEGFWTRAEGRIYAALEAYSEHAIHRGDYQRRLFAGDAARGFAFIDVCRQRYDAVLMNPPFGDGSIPSKEYIDETYGDTKGDVYKAFVECFQARLVPCGYLGIISSRTGFFLGQSEDWRTRVVLRLFRPITLADLGLGVLDAMVEVAAYVLRSISVLEARNLTFALVPVLKAVEVDRKSRFSLPKWQTARHGLKRHQAVSELEQLDKAGFIQRCSGNIIRYVPIWQKVNAVAVPPKPVFPPLVCVRALTETDKEAALLDAITSRASRTVFVCDPAIFEKVPGAPFAYWAGDTFRRLFSTMSPFGNERRAARAGGQTSDDFRYLRAFWECPLKPTVGTWRSYVKGGSYSPFYSDPILLAHWNDSRNTFAGFLGRPGRSSEQPNNHELYFRPGITWPLRAKAFSPQPMPAGCIFTVRGSAILAPQSELLSLLGLVASSTFDYIFKLMLGRFGFPEFAAGILQKIPTPNFTRQVAQSLADFAIQAWSEKRLLDDVNATSHAFRLPALLAVPGNTLSERAIAWGVHVRKIGESIARIQAEIDELAFCLYGLSADERAALSNSLATESAVESSAESSTDSSGELDNEAEDPAEGDISALVAELLAYAIGVAFGRWDVRIATGRLPALAAQNPFDVLPVCPPGQLQNEQGLPMTLNDVERHKEEDRWDYPIEIPWEGILVDDEGHPFDIESSVHKVLKVVFDDNWEAIERGMSDNLDVRTLRDYFRSSSGFFSFHLNRFSKSKRKAPIFWELTTHSHGYAIWLYYHRFTRDTFYKVLNDLVKPKLAHEEQRLASMRAESGKNSTRAQTKELEAQECFVSELAALREEVERIAPLWNPNLNDGVLINFAPLWRLVPQHKAWQQDCKDCWDSLVQGEYDWAHLAMHLWPERVVAKCRDDRSLAIVHGLEDDLWIRDADGKWRPRENVSQAHVDAMVAHRSKPAVKSALEDLLSVSNLGSRTNARRKMK